MLLIKKYSNRRLYDTEESRYITIEELTAKVRVKSTVTGEQVISRRRLRTRSVHIFKGDVEYVIEAIAPLPDYALVERGVMEPLLNSLQLEDEETE